MNKFKSYALLALLGILTLNGCKKDDDMNATGNFTLTIENAFDAKDYFNNGTTGLIDVGMSESFSFNAGQGHYLSFATMFVQSNDLFYGFMENGLALYDGSGNPVTGDVTSMVQLWDAGTEVNEMPGTGPNQPPRQSGPNTGMMESETVRLIATVMDGFTYPMNNTVINVSITHDGGTMFTVTITNMSGSSTLATPFAPGVWVINSMDQTPLYGMGNMASAGLEGIAEDGDNSKMDTNLSGKSGLASPFAPGAYGINDAVFAMGATASAAFESLAEDGDPSGFTNVFNTPVGATSAAPIMPTESYSISFTAEEGDMLSFATMLVQSNDWVIGTPGISLFTDGTALTGDITSMMKLVDAGTEMDEYSGAGNNQPPRQAAANTGTMENGMTTTETMAGSHVPMMSDMIKVTLTAN